MSLKIGFFGGSFSPVHCGHIRLVFTLLEGGYVSRVILVPASDAYAKPGLTPSSLRLQELRSVFRLMHNVEISTIDTEKPYFPHPLETADELVATYSIASRDDLVWVMGGDRLDWICENDDLPRILADYRLIVFERPPYSKERLLQNKVALQNARKIVFLPHWNVTP